MTTEDQWWREEPKRPGENRRMRRSDRESLDDTYGRFQARMIWFYCSFFTIIIVSLWSDVEYGTFRWLDRLHMKKVHRAWQAQREADHGRWMAERARKGLWPYYGPPTPTHILNALHTDQEGVHPTEGPADSKAERGKTRDD